MKEEWILLWIILSQNQRLKLWHMSINIIYLYIILKKKIFSIRSPTLKMQTKEVRIRILHKDEMKMLQQRPVREMSVLSIMAEKKDGSIL